jgi:Transcriptional regulator C-terminal region
MNNLTKMTILKPTNEVFEAFVDPEKIGNFWFSSSSERWEAAKTITLRYDEYNALMQITNEIVNELSDKIVALIHAKELTEKQLLTQLLDYLYIHRNYLLILLNINKFEEQLFSLLKKLVETRRKNTMKDLPDDYVAIDIKTASLVGIIMWWIRQGLHHSSD